MTGIDEQLRLLQNILYLVGRWVTTAAAVWSDRDRAAAPVGRLSLGSASRVTSLWGWLDVARHGILQISCLASNKQPTHFIKHLSQRSTLFSNEDDSLGSASKAADSWNCNIAAIITNQSSSGSETYSMTHSCHSILDPSNILFQYSSIQILFTWGILADTIIPLIFRTSTRNKEKREREREGKRTIKNKWTWTSMRQTFPFHLARMLEDLASLLLSLSISSSPALH